MSEALSEALPKSRPVDEASSKGASAAEALFDEEDAEYADVMPSRAAKELEVPSLPPPAAAPPKSKRKEKTAEPEEKLPKYLVHCEAVITDGGEHVVVPYFQFVDDPESVVHRTSAVLTTRTVRIEAITPAEAKLVRKLRAE